MQFEVNVSDVAGITLQLRSYSQVIHAANVRLPWISELFLDPFAGENLQPPECDLSIRPSGNNIRPGSQHNVQVIRQNSVSQNIDPEDRR
jgi:hypothetical protein